MVLHARALDKRRQQRREREIQASYTTLQTAARAAAPQEYVCRAEAAVAATQRRAVSSASHLLEVAVEERPL